MPIGKQQDYVWPISGRLYLEVEPGDKGYAMLRQPCVVADSYPMVDHSYLCMVSYLMIAFQRISLFLSHAEDRLIWRYGRPRSYVHREDVVSDADAKQHVEVSM